MRDGVRAIETLAGPLPSDVLEATERLLQVRHPSPNLYAVEAGIRTALAARDRGELIRLLKALRGLGPENARDGLRIRSFGESEADRRVADLVAGLPKSARYGKPIRMEQVSEETLSDSRREVAAALAFIGDLDRELIAELREHVRWISIFRGEGVVGVSTPTAFGAIYIREPLKENVLAHYVEHIVHEAAHTHLNALMRLAPLVLNPPDECYRSPLRPDPRPMHGVLHATFVLARIIHVFNRWLEEDESTLPPGRWNFEGLQAKFDEGVAVVRAEGRLTAAGRQVLTSLERASSDLRRRRLRAES